MYSIKKIDAKECNTAKGVILQQNLMNSKMFCLIQRLLDTTWKEFKVKSMN